MGLEDTAVVSASNNTFYTGALMDLRAEPVVQQVTHVTDRDYSFMHAGNELAAGDGRQTIFIDLSDLRQLYLVGKPVEDQEGKINDLK